MLLFFCLGAVWWCSGHQRSATGWSSTRENVVLLQH